MLERQKNMLEKINLMLKEGKLLSSVLFETSEIMTILYEGHIWFARVMDGKAYDLVDLQNDSHVHPTIDYTSGKCKMQIDKISR